MPIRSMPLRSASALSLLFPALALILVIATAPARAAPPAQWRQDWNETLAAANKEGPLSISGPAGRLWRTELMTFEQAYPRIHLSITPFSGRDFWPRFIKEREAAEYLWDLRIGGTDPTAYGLKNEGAFAPIRPLLVLPQVAENRYWHGGLDGIFQDKDRRYLLGFAAFETSLALYNTRFVHQKLDVRDLVDAKWRGKVSMADPRAGASLNNMGALYRRFGPGFIRKFLLTEHPVVTGIPRQQLDWLLSGHYPIAFGLPDATPVEYARRGGDVSMLARIGGLHQLAIGVGGIMMPTHAPHPAAAKVFINWLLTQKVQAQLMKAVKLNSRRKDVPLGRPSAAVDYRRISEYYDNSSEDEQPYTRQAAALIRRVLK